MTSSKMFVLFAIIALSWSAATAIVFPQVIPPTAAWATMSHPCLQYCMLQQPFTMTGSPFTSMIMQQRWALFLLQQQAVPIVSSPATAWLQQQCNCAAVSQMIHQQQTAAQMSYLFNPMVVATPLSYQGNPMTAAMQLPYLTNPMTTTMQLPYLTNPMAVALQLPYLYNPMASTMQLSSMFYPVSRVMQLSSMFSPFAMPSPTTYFQSCAAGACF
uniref:Putative storage protein n=1 Tax=Eragrostis tef TaxID=110835 RepID=A0A173G7S4_ERATE|nr:putative storage protein [Eragrostis tef]